MIMYDVVYDVSLLFCQKIMTACVLSNDEKKDVIDNILKRSGDLKYIKIDIIYTQLQMCDYLAQDEVDKITSETITSQKLLTMFNQLKNKDDYVFLTLQEICYIHKQFDLYNVIQTTLKDSQQNHLIWQPPVRRKAELILRSTLFWVVSSLLAFGPWIIILPCILMNYSIECELSEAPVKVLNENKVGFLIIPEDIHFDVKDPVALFTGREQELCDLHKLVQRSSNKTEMNTKEVSLPEKCTVITGLGGIGKTQLALRYVQLYSDNYNSNILWINAETESSMSSSFRLLASERLNIKLKTVEGQEKTIASVVTEVFKFFSKTKALFIFDNADGPFNNLFFPTGINKPFILITSRMQKWGQFAIYRLDTFTDSDAIQFVKKGLNIINEVEEESIKDLVKLLQNFPLALQQAVSFINETNKESKIIQAEYKITDYLNDYKGKAQSLLDHKFYDETGNQFSTTTYTTWRVTVDKIKNIKDNGQEAIMMLNIMSYFASKKINAMILLPSNGNQSKLVSTIKLLTTYSMVYEEEDGLLNVHPLVQEITLFKLKAEKNERKYFQAAQIVLQKFFEMKKKFVERQQLILPHLESLLIKIKSWIYRNPNEKKVVEQENVIILLEILVVGYNNFDCRKTICLLEELLILEEKHYGQEHYQVAATLVNLGNAYGILGESKMQKDLLERALAIEEKHCGPENYKLATILRNLGNAYATLGNAYGILGESKMQKDLLERALAIEEKYCGPENYKLATILRNLANAYGDLGDPKMQKDLLERAWAIIEKHYGTEDLQMVETLCNAYSILGVQTMKIHLLEAALAVNEKNYGSEHYQVAETLHYLGNAYGDLGDPKMKKDLLERALAIEEKHYGSEHYQVAETLHNLGLAYGALGFKEMQKDFLIRVLAIEEKHYGPEHYKVATILYNLGNAYGDLGDPKMQKDLLERALVIVEKHYGSEHYQAAETLHNPGLAYGALGNKEMQKDFLIRVLAIEEKHFGPEHYKVAKILRNLGNAYGDLGDPKMQKDLLKRALVIEEKYYGSEHYQVALTIKTLLDLVIVH